jgi:hypothetical protein
VHSLDEVCGPRVTLLEGLDTTRGPRVNIDEPWESGTSLGDPSLARLFSVERFSILCTEIAADRSVWVKHTMFPHM